MTDPTLISYIKTQLTARIDEVSLRTAILAQGWKAADVDDCFAAAKKELLAATAPAAPIVPPVTPAVVAPATPVVPVTPIVTQPAALAVTTPVVPVVPISAITAPHIEPTPAVVTKPAVAPISTAISVGPAPRKHSVVPLVLGVLLLVIVVGVGGVVYASVSGLLPFRIPMISDLLPNTPSNLSQAQLTRAAANVHASSTTAVATSTRAVTTTTFATTTNATSTTTHPAATSTSFFQ